MGLKRIFVHDDISLGDWADQNQGIIMDAIYDAITEFAGSSDNEKIILQLIQKSQSKAKTGRYVPATTVDVMLVREMLSDTLTNLMEYMIKREEYEKCSVIKKLIERN